MADGSPRLAIAKGAAQATGVRLVIPNFPGDEGIDFCDLAKICGAVVAKSSLEAATPFPSATGPSPVSFSLFPTDETTIGSRDIRAQIDQLAELTPIQFDKVRKEKSRELGIRSVTLDAAVKAAKKKDDGDELTFEVVEPWSDAIDGAELLTNIADTVRRFIICAEETAHAVALWIAMSWFIDVIMVAPLLVITAPDKRCGKSLMLTLIGKLVPRPLTSSSITPSALFRSIDAWQPTLLIDETDACLKNNEDLRGLINSGHTRDSAYVIRCVGDSHSPKKFSTWGAKALSGIGHVADTLMDRAIILELRRKLSIESVDRIRRAEPSLFDTLRAKLARFADDHGEQVRLARPDLPTSLNDRAQDNWEPLLAIATVAGGDWPKIATASAMKLCGSDDLSLSQGSELLLDIREILEQREIAYISSAELIKALCTLDERTWSIFNKGFPMTPRQLAAKLKGYGLESKTIRLGSGRTPKGYEVSHFTEVFSRYLPMTVTVSATTPQVCLGKVSRIADA